MNRKLRWPLAILTAVLAVLVAAPGAAGVPSSRPAPATAAVSAPRAVADIIPPRTPYPTVLNPSPTPSLAPITVMSVGDSLTEGHGPDGTTTESYRPELGRLMSLTGQPFTWVVAAEGGTKCSWWAALMASLLATYNPDVVFLDCGTNDTPTDNTEADYRTILNAVAAYNASGHNTLLVAALIGQPDMDSDTNTVRPEIWDWMHNTSLAIGRALADYPDVPVADMVLVPNNIEWLQSDGIHLIARSEAAYGQLFYRAAQPRMGWLTIEAMRARPMCGLSGHWRGTVWPVPDGVVYRVCTLA